jgi:hypothetical protein
MSGGFSRVLRPFGLVRDAGELVRRVVAGEARDLLAALRAAEAADPRRVRVPRFGAHDDATLLWTRI